MSESAAWNLIPPQFRHGFDAAINMQSSKETVWLVKGASVLEWDLAKGKPVGEVGQLGQTAPFDDLPHPFDGNQPAAHNASKINVFIDSAVLRKQGTSEVFLFHANLYLLYDFETKQTLDGPAELESWTELPAPFNQRIDAAVNRRGDTHQMLLFSGTQFVRWNMDEKALVQPEGGPFVTALHGQFSGLGLHTCAGYDLERIGANSSLVRQLSQLSPNPAAKENVVAGTSWPGYADNAQLQDTIAAAADGNCGKAAAFDNPAGVAVLGIGTGTPYGYVADSHNNAIRRVSLSGCDSQQRGCKPGNVTTVAGGSEYAGFKDGLGAAARFFRPRGISGVRVVSGLNPGDLLYIADTGNSAVRRLFIPQGNDAAQVLTAAGGSSQQCDKCISKFDPGLHDCTGCCECQQHGFGDGVGAMADFNAPTDVALLYEPESRGIGSNEYIYVTDARNHALRRIVVKPGIEAPGQTGEVSTIAGSSDEQHRPTAGFMDGNGAKAQFSCVNKEGVPGCALAALRDQRAQNDVLYVADTKNNALRRIVVPTKFSGLVSKPVELAPEESEAEPGSRRLLSQVVDLEADEAQEAPAARYTAQGGSAPKDMQCTLPFLFGNLAHNDCIKTTEPSLGITDQLVEPNGWCPTGSGSNPKWGPCQPVGYTPTYCVMSPWSVFGKCSQPCGGGVQTRTRSIQIDGDGGMGCPVLNQTRPCGLFECGQVSTLAGGGAGGNLAPFGTLEDGTTPDSSFFPQAVSLHVNGYQDDVVFVSGDPRTSSLLKRAEVKKGVVQTEADCAPGHKHIPGVDVAIEGAKCTMPISNVGSFVGLTGLSAVSEQLVIATSTQHTLTGLDLSLHIECEPWVTNSLNHWDSDPLSTGEVKQTSPLTAFLTPSSGFVNNWKFAGFRRVQNMPDLKFGSGNLVKNVMCFQEEARPGEGIITQQSCCVTKAGPKLTKPTLCSLLGSAGTEHCAQAPTPATLEVQDQAGCHPGVCVRETSGPGSSAWTEAEDQQKTALADYVAEMALIGQNLQAM